MRKNCLREELEDNKEKPNGNFITEKHKTEIKSSVGGFNIRMERREERINELEDRTVEIIQSEQQRKWRETQGPVEL